MRKLIQQFVSTMTRSLVFLGITLLSDGFHFSQNIFFRDFVGAENIKEIIEFGTDALIGEGFAKSQLRTHWHLLKQ